jgi:lauroyl/myristoyl acyltransferase
MSTQSNPGVPAGTRAAAAGPSADADRPAGPGAPADAEQDATLERVSRRPRPPRLPPVALRIRVKTSPLLRSLIPARPLVDRAIRHGRALWDTSPEQRANAIATMAAIVAGTARAEEVEALAQEHLIEREVDKVFFWRYWSCKLDDASAVLVREALSSGRGVVVSACHSGAYYLSMRERPFRRAEQYSVVGAWFMEPPSHDYWGRRLARWRKGALGRPISARGSFPILAALLARGKLLYLFYDMPGSRETRFLGKTAMLADGTARLAAATDALVVPLRARRIASRVWLQAAAPLDPRQHAGAEELHHALAAHHERWILEEPAMMADPNSFGWEGGALPERWSRP